MKHGIIKAVEIDQNERIKDMAEILMAALEEVREGKVAAIGLFKITPDHVVATQWAMHSKSGHGSMLLHGASQLIYDLHRTKEETP